MRIIIAFLFSGLVLLAGTNSVPPLVQIPWAIDPASSTNHTRTNLPAWWDTTNDYSAGVRMWQMTQATMENFNRLTNHMSGTNALATTNTPNPGDALRWNGTNLYWAP